MDWRENWPNRIENLFHIFLKKKIITERNKTQYVLACWWLHLSSLSDVHDVHICLVAPVCFFLDMVEPNHMIFFLIVWWGHGNYRGDMHSGDRRAHIRVVITATTYQKLIYFNIDYSFPSRGRLLLRSTTEEDPLQLCVCLGASFCLSSLLPLQVTCATRWIGGVELNVCLNRWPNSVPYSR